MDEEKINKDAAELGNCLKLGKLKEVALPWHEYLKEKKLLLFKLGEGYSLLSIVGEKGLRGLCKWYYENDKKGFDEMGYESLNDWIEECELGNDGFGLDKGEIEELGGMGELRKQLGEIK